MKKLYFIYTIPDFYDKLYRPVMAEAFDGRQDVVVRFAADTSLVLDTLANDVRPTPAVKRSLLRQALCCADAGADVIVVGCTAVNTATPEIAKLLDVPMFSVEEPMLQKVLAGGARRIAVLSHTEINAMTIKRRLIEKDSGVEVDLFPVAGAAEAFQRGDREGFSQLMRDGAARVPDGYDALVLGHISADVVDLSHVRIPVFRSGACCIEAIERLLKEGV